MIKGGSLNEFPGTGQVGCLQPVKVDPAWRLRPGSSYRHLNVNKTTVYRSSASIRKSL